MTARATPQQTTAKPSGTAGGYQVLQRQCACGSRASGLSGTCLECHRKKALLQAKLAVASPDDPLELEADRVADRVMSFGPRDALGSSPTLIQRQTRPDTRTASDTPSSVDHVLSSAGRPLEPHLKSEMESRFGYGFSDVRVHTDTAAGQSARDVSALAYTVGNDIVFSAGRFAPETQQGRRLLAHELTHVIQQSTISSGNKGNSNGTAPSAAYRPPRISTLSGDSNRLQRRWDRPRTGDCSDVSDDRWIRKVVVEQETPQSVTLHWSDGSLETAGCSTGKGHCCVDTPDGVPCDRARSRTNGSNCTPISAGAEYPISDRRREHNGWQFWNTFVPSRGIALHEYPVVDGTPLSHGCVRLPLNTARHIFCGERQNQTMVEVRGFARPRCDHAQLRHEWLGDIAGTATPGSDGEEYRTIVRDGYGHNLSDSERSDLLKRKSSLPLPPPCPSGRRGALPTVEERRTLPTGSTKASVGVTDPVRPDATATVPGAVSPTAAQHSLESSGFERLIPRFSAALSRAGSLTQTRRVVRREASNLWSTATLRAQRRASADTDDRPLYAARLEMSRALRGFQPPWTLTATDRDALMTLFEDASRGRDSADFSGARRGAKRILISGFDPFRGSGRGNPSGAAVLALDGQNLTSGSVHGRVEGTIFPVRFADFNGGQVEAFFGPFLTGSNRVDMVMTISEGGREFEVEEFAARRRTNERGHTDNLGVRGDLAAPNAPRAASIGGRNAPATLPVPGLAPGPEFLRTTLPSAVRSGLRSSPLRGETEVTEVPQGRTDAVEQPVNGPTAGSTAISGSGGNFLSNEIFYRTRLLRDTNGSTVPMGHLHVPSLDTAGSSTTAISAAREAIVARIRQILIDTLPTI